MDSNGYSEVTVGKIQVNSTAMVSYGATSGSISVLHLVMKLS